LPDGSYLFSDPASATPLPLVVIGGGPGSGKTSLLAAIVALMEHCGARHLPSDPRALLRHGAGGGSVSGEWLLSPSEQERAGLEQPVYSATLPLAAREPRLPEPDVEAVFRDFSRDPAAPKVELFPANRQLEPRQRPTYPADLDHGRFRVTARRDKYAGFEHVLCRLATEAGIDALARTRADGILLVADLRDALHACRATIAALNPRLQLLRVEPREGRPLVWFQHGSAEVELYELSHGEQQAVLFAVTYHYLGLRRSLILIDEPELHLHPDEQLGFLTAFAALSDGGQIIAATSSPEIIKGIPRQQLILLPGARKERM
jgi:predicted ATPase